MLLNKLNNLSQVTAFLLFLVGTQCSNSNLDIFFYYNKLPAFSFSLHLIIIMCLLEVIIGTLKSVLKSFYFMEIFSISSC